MASGDTLRAGGKAAFQVVDWNNDGKKDLLIGTESNGTFIYLNNGKNSAPVFDKSINIKGNRDNYADGKRFMMWRATPRAFDMNGDGKKDLIINNSAYGEIFLYLNTGTDAEPLFDDPAVKLSIGDDKMSDESLQTNPLWFDMYDWNGDGKIDIIGGSYKAFNTLYLNISGK